MIYYYMYNMYVSKIYIHADGRYKHPGRRRLGWLVSSFYNPLILTTNTDMTCTCP